MSSGQRFEVFGLLVTLLEQLGWMGFPHCPPQCRQSCFSGKCPLNGFWQQVSMVMTF